MDRSGRASSAHVHNRASSLISFRTKGWRWKRVLQRRRYGGLLLCPDPRNGDDVRFPSFHDAPMKWKNERRGTNQWMPLHFGLQASSPFRLQTKDPEDWEMGLPRSFCGWLPGLHRGRGDCWSCPLDPSGGLQHDPNTGSVSVSGYDPLLWSPRSPIGTVHRNNEVVCLKKAGKAGRGRTGDARGGVHGRGTCIVQHRRK